MQFYHLINYTFFKIIFIVISCILHDLYVFRNNKFELIKIEMKLSQPSYFGNFSAILQRAGSKF